MKRFALVAVLVAACGGSGISAQVVSTANTLGVGEQRILVEFMEKPSELVAVLRDENGSPLDEDEGLSVVSAETTVMAFYLEIPEAGTYQLTIGDVGPLGFVAVEDPVQVTLGEVAPEGRGQIVVLASPDHCPSGTCQSMIEVAKVVGGRDVVQIEVFENPDAEDPVLSPEIAAWGIPGQPWMYVIDTDGIVTAVFEGVVSEDELRQALGSG